jgi:hypothetical protein
MKEKFKEWYGYCHQPKKDILFAGFVGYSATKEYIKPEEKNDLISFLRTMIDQKICKQCTYMNCEIKSFIK